MRRTDKQVGDWKEWRRLRAWQLYQQGWNQKEIGIALGASKGAVSQWIKTGKAEGDVDSQLPYLRHPLISEDQQGNRSMIFLWHDNPYLHLLEERVRAYNRSGSARITQRFLC